MGVNSSKKVYKKQYQTISKVQHINTDEEFDEEAFNDIFDKAFNNKFFNGQNTDDEENDDDEEEKDDNNEEEDDDESEEDFSTYGFENITDINSSGKTQLQWWLSWPFIVSMTIIFFPIGGYLIWKKMDTDKKVEYEIDLSLKHNHTSNGINDNISHDDSGKGKIQVVVCKNCGANNKIAKGSVCECEYCGSPLGTKH